MRCPTALIAAVLALSLPLLGAESPKEMDEREAKEAAVEDASSDRALMEQELVGTIKLNPVKDGEPLPKVLGTFTTATKSFQIKLLSDQLYGDLKKQDNKTTTVFGKLRNAGKYLVITRVGPSQAAEPPREKRSRRGM